MTTTPALEPLFVSVPDAATMLAVDRAVIYKLLNDTTLKGARQGTKRLVSVASLREYAQLLIDAETVAADD